MRCNAVEAPPSSPSTGISRSRSSADPDATCSSDPRACAVEAAGSGTNDATPTMYRA